MRYNKTATVMVKRGIVVYTCQFAVHFQNNAHKNINTCTLTHLPLPTIATMSIEHQQVF